MSLYHKIQKAKDNPDTQRTGSYWSPEEDSKLAQSVLDDRPLAEIALEHKRTTGGIEIRLRTIAYNDYKNSSESTVSDIAKKYRIPEDELTVFVRDRERYLEIKNKERDELQKKKDEERLKRDQEKLQRLNEKLKEKQEEKERREKARLDDEEEKKKIIEIKEKEKKEREEDETCFNYIYCIREREFLKNKENIYKVGKTSVHPFKRMKQYPNGSDLILLLKVQDCHASETALLKFLDSRFKTARYNGQRIGREYYEAPSETDFVKNILECVL